MTYQPADNPYDGGYRRRWIPMDTRSAVVTYIIIAINIVMFLLLNGMVRVMGWSQSAAITALGAKENHLIATGQYWRLVTPIFLHYDLSHLFFNCYGIFIYGSIVEKLYGRVKYVILYLTAGIMGCLFSYLFSIPPSIGASGSVFGLLGALLYFRQRWKDIFRRLFGPSLFIIIGANLFFGFTSSGVDNWGHIGGLIGGFLAGNALGLYRDNKFHFDKVIFALGIVALLAGGIKLGYYLNLGDVYNALERDQYDIALAEVADAVEQRHDDQRVIQAAADVHIERINYFGSIRDIDAARAEADRLVEWYPDQAAFQRIRAQVYDWGQ